MSLVQIRRTEKYLKSDCPIDLELMSITEQHQAVKLDERNIINFLKSWLKQPNFLKKWHISKSLPADVETEYLNDRIDYLTKNLNNYRKFSQNFNCDFSYLNSLSKLKLQYLNCGSLTKSTQDCLPHLTVFQSSNYKRHKINFGVLKSFCNVFLPRLWRLY